MKKLLFLALAAVFLVVNTACKRTVEGENNKWESNKERIGKLKAKYPGFSSPLNEVMTQAEAKFKEAETVSGEEGKIELLSAANKIASPNFVTKLDGLDRKINNIEDLATKAAQAATDESDREAAKSAKRSATVAIENARREVRNAKANSIASAEAVIEGITLNLNRAEDRLEKVLKVAEAKKDAEEKTAEDEKTAEEDAKAAEEEKTAAIKCGYCGTMNEAGALKCSGCKAPIEK